jgi:hypothetical protein
VLDRRALVTAVEATLAERICLPALERALARRGVAADVPTELAKIVGELFDLIARTRRAADAMERCAAEAPDLAELFYRGVRGRLLTQLGDYFGRVAATGAIDNTMTPDLTARFVMETTTWWARHRHRDPEPLTIAEDAVRNIAASLIVRALCRTAGSTGADEQTLD